MNKKYHLSPDGILRECKAVGKCPIAPSIFHFNSDEINMAQKDLDRYNELKAKNEYANVNLSSMLYGFRNLSEDSFILNEDTISSLPNVDLLIILENSKSKLKDLKEQRNALKPDLIKIYNECVKIDQDIEDIYDEDFVKEWKANYIKEHNLKDDTQNADKLVLRGDFTIMFSDHTSKDFKDTKVIYDYDTEFSESIYEVEGVSKSIKFITFTDNNKNSEMSRYKINKKVFGTKNIHSETNHLVDTAFNDYKANLFEQCDENDQAMSNIIHKRDTLELNYTEQERIVNIVSEEIEKRNKNF